MPVSHWPYWVHVHPTCWTYIGRVPNIYWVRPQFSNCGRTRSRAAYSNVCQRTPAYCQCTLGIYITRVIWTKTAYIASYVIYYGQWDTGFSVRFLSYFLSFSSVKYKLVNYLFWFPLLIYWAKVCFKK